jgi:hypothetical protein
MSNSDFIPGKDAEFAQWARSFITALLPMCERIGFPVDLYQQLVTENNTFADKYNLAEAPSTRTKVIVLEKNEARKVLTQTLRQAVGEYISRNHLVTDIDRESLGLPIRKTTRTPAPVATTFPDIDVDSRMIRQLTFHFYEQGKKKSRAKPQGQHGAEIRWAIRDTAPTVISELINSSFDTHTPFTLIFDENLRGKTVYFCLCWENTRGEKGPWSKIQSAIIP